MAILDEIGASIRQLAEGAGPSVVGIGQRRGVGTGIVLGDGKVLTATWPSSASTPAEDPHCRGPTTRPRR